MNAKVGIEASRPASPTTKRMNRIESPSVQRNDRITLAISTSGATSARSRIARMIAITSSASGTISFRSRSVAWSKSYWIALPPPTSTVAPSHRVRRPRRGSRARSPSDDLVSGSWSSTIAAVPIVPSVDVCGSGVADGDPVDALRRLRRRRDLLLGHRRRSSDSTSIVIGESTPGGNASSSSWKPSTPRPTS